MWAKKLRLTTVMLTTLQENLELSGPVHATCTLELTAQKWTDGQWHENNRKCRDIILCWQYSEIGGSLLVIQAAAHYKRSDKDFTGLHIFTKVTGENVQLCYGLPEVQGLTFESKLTLLRCTIHIGVSSADVFTETAWHSGVSAKTFVCATSQHQ